MRLGPGQIPTLLVEADGSELTAPAMQRLTNLVVDNSLHKPDMFVITFADDEAEVMGATHLRVGSQITVTANGWMNDEMLTLIEGEVTSIEAAYEGMASETIIRGYDKSHRLHRGSRTATYNNVKDSDIAQTIANRLGCEIGTIDDSGTTLDYVAQFNQTDWEFLSARAREIGFEMSVTEGKFNFRRPISASTGPDSPDGGLPSSTQLTYGFDLRTFHPRVSAVGQPGDVAVRSWDPMQKQVIQSSSSNSASHFAVATDLSQLTESFGDATHTIVDRPVGTQGEADRIAQAGAAQTGSSGFEGEGMVLGNPTLRPGVPVNISGVVDPFNGRYTLTETRHVFQAGDYLTHFTVSGQRDRSLLGLTSSGGSHSRPSAGGAPIPGVVIAQVTDNNDPNNLGRVKLKFPWLSDDYESDWCRYCQLGAGPSSGAHWWPEVNDEVLVAFEFGDVRRPYVVGNLHNGQDTPNLGDSLFNGGQVARRGFVSRAGHMMVFFDDSSKMGVALLTADSSCKVALNQTSGEIHISCSGQVTIETDSGDVTVNSGGDVNVSSNGDVSVTASAGSITLDGGSGVTIQSEAQVTISAPQVSLGGG
ncbi:MAG TPA: VgrG-related protein [Acidimicrobiales bacterium]|jgi:phage protein D|nr:VgrG-related protein [Acidimicrobiales bacterium]